MFFLPPYLAEMNPDEYLNYSLKMDVHSGEHPRTRKDIYHKIESFLRRLQHHKDDRVAALFQHKKLVCCLGAE